MSADAPLLLIVDDEPRILSALRRSLRREPYQVVAVESFREAFGVLESHSVALLLSDHKMPGKTGLQFLAEVAERHPRVVRILITGWMESIPQEEIDPVGLWAVIDKPWDDAELKATLRAALEGRHAQPAAGSEDGSPGLPLQPSRPLR